MKFFLIGIHKVLKRKFAVYYFEAKTWKMSIGKLFSKDEISMIRNICVYSCILP